MVIKENRYIRAGYSWDWADDASGKLKLCDNDSSASYRFQNKTHTVRQRRHMPGGRHRQLSGTRHTHTFRPELSFNYLHLSFFKEIFF